MMKNYVAAGVLLLVIAAAGCSNINAGRHFALNLFIQNVEYGQTTQQQVRQWLGEPGSTGMTLDTSGTQYEEWIYYSATGRLPDMAGARFKFLQIKFDHNKRVKGYTWTDPAR